MALDPVTNFAKCTVSQGYDASATSIELAAGDGAKLPSSDSFNLVWWESDDYPDPTNDPNVEIVRCTSRTGDTLTIVRAQEETAATTKNTAGGSYKVLLGATKKTIDDISSHIDNVSNPHMVTLTQVGGTTDHTLLSNIGANTHAQIDTHIADSTVHFTEGSIDHGSISGLLDDDHTQYILADGTRAFTGDVLLTSTGDIELIIEADSDNSGENDNPRLVLKQDGGGINGLFGINGIAGARFTDALINATYIEPQRASAGVALQFVTGATIVGGVDGVARMTILGDGKIGIGTNAPTAELEISGLTTPELKVTETGSSVVLVARSQSNNLAFIGTTSNHPTLFVTNNTAQGIILATGLFGIGTTSPDAMLEIETNSSTEEGLKIKGSASQTGDLFLVADSSDNILSRITSVGNGWFAGNLEIDGDLNHDGGNAGFYGIAPVAQQTGVAVTAAGVHAALVNLGLITA